MVTANVHPPTHEFLAEQTASVNTLSICSQAFFLYISLMQGHLTDLRSMHGLQKILTLVLMDLRIFSTWFLFSYISLHDTRLSLSCLLVPENETALPKTLFEFVRTTMYSPFAISTTIKTTDFLFVIPDLKLHEKPQLACFLLKYCTRFTWLDLLNEVGVTNQMEIRHFWLLRSSWFGKLSYEKETL